MNISKIKAWFRSRIKKSRGCWHWEGGPFVKIDDNEYFYPREVAWLLAGNHREPHQHLKPICGNLACVKPSHLAIIGQEAHAEQLSAAKPVETLPDGNEPSTPAKKRPKHKKRVEPKEPKERTKRKNRTKSKKPKEQAKPRKRTQPKNPKERAKPRKRTQPKKPKERAKPRKRTQPKKPKERAKPRKRTSPSNRAPKRERREAKFWKEVTQKANGCWVWNRGSAFRFGGRHMTPRRLAWYFSGRPDPGEEFRLERQCATPKCIRPEHMAPRKLKAFTPEAFEQNVSRNENGCWVWEGPATVNYKGHTYRPSRLSLLLAGKVMEKDQRVRRTCKTRHCVNPAHLEVR